MKYKNDFVTNSSSACFILQIHTDIISLKKFKKSWDKYIDSFISETKWIIDRQVEKYKENMNKNKKRLKKLENKIKNNSITEHEQTMYNLFYNNWRQNPTEEEIIKTILGNMSVEKVSTTTYQVVHETSMYNYILSDVPKYMLHMIVMDNIDHNKFHNLGFLSCKLSIEEDNDHQ